MLFRAAIYAGKLAAYWNLPHFSFSSTNPELMDKVMFSTLVRLMSPLNHLATALRHVFNFFGASIATIITVADIGQIIKPVGVCVHSYGRIFYQFSSKLAQR